MRNRPEIIYDGEPDCDFYRGYHYSISADDGDNMRRWMEEAEATIKRLGMVLSLWLNAAKALDKLNFGPKFFTAIEETEQVLKE